MGNMNYTSIEQSKKLIELGLNIETADMRYEKECKEAILGFNTVAYEYSKGYSVPYIPCWSIGALMEMMPNINDDDEIANPCLVKSSGEEYYVTYTTLTKEILSSDIYANPVDACYEMVVWLLNHCYIKKEN